MSNTELSQTIFWHHCKVAQRQQFITKENHLWTWARNLIDYFSLETQNDARVAELSFMRFYLSNTASLCLTFLPINSFSLMCAIYIILQEKFGEAHAAIDPTFRSFVPAVVEISVWIVLSIMIFVFFMAWQYRPGSLAKLSNTRFCNIWYEIGAAVLFTRLLILVVRITQMAQSGGQCLDAPDLVGIADNTFGYMLIKMLVDTYQAFVMVMLPFPQPWGAVATLVELTRQILRLYSCADRITTDPDQMWIIQLAIILLIYTYTFLLLLPALYLEASFRNRFRSEQMQREAEQGKREMVGFLSTDVRVPLQYMLHAVSSVDFVGIAGSNVQPLLSDIHRYSAIVNDIADELLLVVRISESRYTTKLTQVTDLRRLLDDTVDFALQRQRPSSNRANPLPADAMQYNLDVQVAAPAISIELDQQCFLAALRHILVYLAQESQQLQQETSGEKQETENRGARASPAEDAPINEVARQSQGLRMSASLRNRSSAKTPILLASVPRQCAGVLEVRVSCVKKVHKAADSEARRVHQATSLYVCATIAAACAGTFAAEESSGDFVLSVPCRSDPSAFAAAEPVALPEAARVSTLHADDGASADQVSAQAHPQRNRYVADALQEEQALLDDKILASAAMQTWFKRNKVCAIVADSVLGSVITRAIKRLKLDDGLTVLHELQRGAYVPVARLTFVTTYELCHELRMRQYSGLIVLFSGSANYLDDNQNLNVDYCLPLPCSDLHMGRFVDWLVGVHEREIADLSMKNIVQEKQKSSLKGDPSSALSKGMSAAVSPPRHSKRWFSKSAFEPGLSLLLRALLKSAEAVCTVLVSAATTVCNCIYSKDMFFMVTPLPRGTLENYIKWKLLNPSQSWYHHSAEVWIMAFPRFFIALFLETLLFGKTLPNVLTTAVSTGLCLSRGLVYRFVLKPRGWKFYHFWLILPLMIVIYLVAVILQTSSSAVPRPMTLAEFQDTDFFGISGKHQLYAMLMTGASQRIYAIYWMHPINQFVIVLSFVRSCQILWLIARFLATVQMASFLQLGYAQISLFNLVYLTHLEHCYRKEFTATHDHILHKAFLDRCMEICQRDVRKPLESLLEHKKELMQVLNRSAASRAFKIGKSLMARLEPLHLSHVLLAEMVHEFGYAHYLLPAEEGAAPVRQPLETLQLGRAVAALVTAFSSSVADHNVRIVAEVGVELTVIRVDWPMLSVLLTNLISAALRNIRDDCIETPRKNDLVSTVFVKIVSISTEEKVPFVAPRLMLVNVCDSSSRAARLRQADALTEGAGRMDPTASATSGVASSVLDGVEKDMFQYGRSMCARLVQKVSPNPIFHTIYSPESPLKTVQRFTFPYHLCSQTRRSQEYLEAETKLPYVTIRVCPSTYLATYERIVRPSAFPKTNKHGVVMHEPGKKHIVLVTCVDPKMKTETLALAGRLGTYGWKCVLKYVLRIPSLKSIGAADCVLIDQQLELQEQVSICEIVLKLRVCGFSGVIAVVLTENLRQTDELREDLARSAASVDLELYAPLTDLKIQMLTAAMERKCIKQVLSMSSCS